jgi:hypothetical protein
MAIIIYGMKCPLCDNSLEEGDEIVAFSPFVANELDPLFIFSDGAFHAKCFRLHPLSGRAQERYEESLTQLSPNNRYCVVCKREIKTPEDYFVIGKLVEDNSDPLHHFNYTQAHRSCLTKWAELPYVYELLEDLKQSGAWRGKYLDRLLIELRSALSFDPPDSNFGLSV